MVKFNAKQIVKSLQVTMAKHSPEILTGIGIAGMVATTVLAVRATPKALALLEEKSSKGSAFQLLIQLKLPGSAIFLLL